MYEGPSPPSWLSDSPCPSTPPIPLEQSPTQEGSYSSCTASELSEDSEEENPSEVNVEQNMTWCTVEDAEQARVERLAYFTRDQPLLPPRPDNANMAWTDVQSGINFPDCHCAFAGCSWVSNTMPCNIDLVTRIFGIPMMVYGSSTSRVRSWRLEFMLVVGNRLD